MAKNEVEQDWREEAGRRLKEKQSKGRFKLPEGETTIRILPRIGSKKSQTPFFEYLVHREVGPNKRFVRCGKTMHQDGDCWLCDKKIPDLQGGDSAKQKRAAALQAKEQFVVQVATVDPDSGKMQGPFLWAVPTGGARSLSARLLGVLKSTKRDYVDPEKGYNLTIERTGMTMTDTVYGQPTPDEESSAISDKVLKRAKPFSEYVPSYSEEQQKAAYFGRDEEAEAEEDETRPAEEDETEEDEAPKGKKKPVEDEDEEETPKPKGKKKPVDEDEPEPDEDEEETPKSKGKKKPVDEDDEPEEDERPKGKKKPVEDEDETEPVEEDEEEVPKSKGKKKPTEDEDEPEEDEPAPSKKGKKKVEEDDEEERPKSKKKPVEDDDD